MFIYTYFRQANNFNTKWELIFETDELIEVLNEKELILAYVSISITAVASLGNISEIAFGNEVFSHEVSCSAYFTNLHLYFYSFVRRKFAKRKRRRTKIEFEHFVPIYYLLW